MIDFGRVAVLVGGASAEREISLRSGKAVFDALAESGVDVLWFDPASESVLKLPELGVDRVFVALHGRGGEDGQVQAVLEMLNLPYTGSGVLACALTMDKSRTKQLWKGVGLPTAAAETIGAADIGRINASSLLAKLGGRVMVKPSHEGSSIGMNQAATSDELMTALHEAAKFDQEILVEAWLSGPEYTVAVLNDKALPAIRVKTPHAFYDYAAKYQDNTTEYICPAGLSDSKEQEVRELALKAFRAAGGKGWGRVDMMMDEQNEFQLLEMNTVPGMTEKSLVPMAAREQGLSFSDLVTEILAGTLPQEQ